MNPQCPPCADHDGYWAEWKIVEFVQDVLNAREENDERKAG